MQKLAVLVLITCLLVLGACGGGGGGGGGGKEYVGRWEAQVQRGFQRQAMLYDIKHVSGKDYLINVEVNGVKQDQTIAAVYENNTFKLPGGEFAVLDGTERMLLSGMDFRKLK